MRSHRTLQTVHSVSVRDNYQQNEVINIALGSVAIVLPIVLILYVFGYRRYRDRAVKRKIAQLERIWHLSSQGKNIESVGDD